MKLTLKREQWKIVWQKLRDAGSPSPLMANVEQSGKATKDRTFATEGSFYDFAEVVALAKESNYDLAQVIAMELSLQLWAEVQALKPLMESESNAGV